MRDQLLLLYELQEIDSQLLVRSERLKEIPIKANETKAELEKAQLALRGAQSHEDEANRDRRKLEHDLAAEKEKLKKWEARLNDIKNSREFAALSREIEGLKRQNRELEESILQKMQAAEDAGKERAEHQGQVDVLQKEFSARDTEAKKASAAVKAEMDQAASSRQAVAGKVKKNLLRQYEYIRDHKGGRALVLVKDGCCLGCHMQVPPQLYNELQRGDAVHACPMCQRILFWEQLAQRTVEDQATAHA